MSLRTFFRNLLAPLKGGISNAVDAPQGAPTIKAGPLNISRAAYNLIVEFEVGGRDYYERKLQHPTWPGAASGLTIGFGYDLGYNNPATIRANWHGLIPSPQLERLAKLSGITGQKAASLPKLVRDITVPWSAAQTVFSEQSLPRFGRLTADTFPGVTKLTADQQGVLLSLVFNRGSSLDGERRSEMRAIRDLVATGNVASVPFQIRKMKRLWQGQGVDGLLRRRDAEAKLFEST